MKVQYNGETDSVTYLSSEGDTSSDLQGYGSQRLVGIILCMRRWHWQRIILATSLLFSTTALVISTMNFMQTSQPLAAPTYSGQEVESVTSYYNFATTPYESSGQGEITTSAPKSCTDVVMETVMRELKLHENALIDKFLDHVRHNKKVNDDYQRRVSKELAILKMERNETLSILEQLSTVQAIVNNTVKFHDMEVALTEYSAAAQRQVDSVLESVARISRHMQSELEKVIFSTNNCSTRFDTLAADVRVLWSGTIRHREEFTNLSTNFTNLETAVATDRERSRTEVNRLDAVTDNLSTLVQKNTENIQITYKRCDDMVTSLRNTLSRVNATAAAKILHASSFMQQAVHGVSAKLDAQLGSTKSQLTYNIRRMDQRISAVQAKVAPIRGKSIAQVLESVDTSLKNIRTALNGKANRGWVAAPNGYEYYVSIDLFSTWNDAKEKCDKIGSKLAYAGIRNKNMNNYVYENLVKPSGNNAWIGLSDSGREGLWRWIDGQPVGSFHTNWANGQPNNFKRDKTDQDCAEIDVQDGRWNDIWCSRMSTSARNVALCERKY